ncbi:hypothetical protein Tco_0159761, partial [Tanacetum coccineum]
MSAKAEPSVHKDPLFNELDDDEIDNMDIEDLVLTIKKLVLTDQKLVLTDPKLVPTRKKISTDTPKVSTDGSKDSTDKKKDSTDRTDEGSSQHEPSQSSFKREGEIEFKDIEEIERPRPTSTRSLLTLKPLPKIDPKDKGKKKIEEGDESDTESKGISEAEKKFKQLSRDKEMARK